LWNRNGVLMLKFMQQGTTITSQMLRNTNKNFIGPFRTKCVEC
jgi:hypothetical protein